MKQKELLEHQAREELFKAQKKFQDEKRLYEDAVCNYYKTLDYIRANYSEGNPLFKTYIKNLLKANNIKDFEIENYDDKNVFEKMLLNLNGYKLSCMPDLICKKITELNPDSIDKFSAVFASYKNKYLLDLILQNSKKPDYINKKIKPIIKDTYGVIVFEEQANEIINLVLDVNEYEREMFQVSLYKLHKLEGLYDLDCSVSLINHIRKNYCETYIEQFKTPYFGFVSSAVEKGIKEDKAKKLFNLLLAYFIDSRRYFRNEKILEAKQLYKISFIELNYPNKLDSEAENGK